MDFIGQEPFFRPGYRVKKGHVYTPDLEGSGVLRKENA